MIDRWGTSGRLGLSLALACMGFLVTAISAPAAPTANRQSFPTQTLLQKKRASLPPLGLIGPRLSDHQEVYYSVIDGRLFDLEESGQGAHQGRFKFELGFQGNTQLYRSRYLSADGSKILAEERVRVRDGILYDYRTIQTQGDLWGLVSVDRTHRRISYELKKKGKRAKFTEERWRGEESLVPPPLIVYRVLRSWKTISQGETQKFLIPIPHEQGSFRFKLQKNNESKNEVELALRPRSFFLQMFVEPLRFAWSRKSNRLAWFVGRVLSRRAKSDGSGFESMDARIVIDEMNASPLMDQQRISATSF